MSSSSCSFRFSAQTHASDEEWRYSRGVDPRKDRLTIGDGISARRQTTTGMDILPLDSLPGTGFYTLETDIRHAIDYGMSGSSILDGL